MPPRITTVCSAHSTDNFSYKKGLRWELSRRQQQDRNNESKSKARRSYAEETSRFLSSTSSEELVGFELEGHLAANGFLHSGGERGPKDIRRG
ncbi:hypothetical protein RB195_015457 [Necator americanus]|uniref:Uncharacterized protein n=1 Tax=Necator americanus TaxID=51031 RepID=A0ABR1E4T1_NECAM